MTQERTGVSEGASVEATPAMPPATTDGPLHPADAPAAAPSGSPFTLAAAKAEIDRLAAEHDQVQGAEGRRPTAIELGKQQVAGIRADLDAMHGRDTGPLVQVHGLNVIPVDQDDHVALVYQGVAGA